MARHGNAILSRVRPRIVLTRGKTPATPYAAYVARLREAGAEPIEVIDPEDIPAEFDAVCLAGGPDVDPIRYGQERDGARDPDLHRDSLELDVVLPRAAGKPVLAICRGLQVLNVFRCGTLIQDIGDDHRAKHDDVKSHPVRIEPGTRLAEVCGTSLVVNSRHHQVLDRLGQGLKSSAWAGDVIEAAELSGGAWVVGVQWHPERVQDGLSDNGIRIFDAFVEAARRVPAR